MIVSITVIISNFAIIIISSLYSFFYYSMCLGKVEKKIIVNVGAILEKDRYYLCLDLHVFNLYGFILKFNIINLYINYNIINLYLKTNEI